MSKVLKYPQRSSLSKALTVLSHLNAVNISSSFHICPLYPEADENDLVIGLVI